MRSSSLNLAQRPFSNQAPVMRAGVLLGALGLLLLVVNVISYRSYFAGAGEEARSELREVERQIASLDAALVELRRELGDYDLEAINSQVSLLNLKIAERTFGWSRLFEDLAVVLPKDVRLQRLTPRLAGQGGRGAVLLTLQGVARRDEGLLTLIDALFAHPRFRDPNPSRETEREGQQQFGLTVTYLPDEVVPSSATPGTAEEGQEAGH